MLTDRQKQVLEEADEIREELYKRQKKERAQQRREARKRQKQEYELKLREEQRIEDETNRIVKQEDDIKSEHFDMSFCNLKESLQPEREEQRQILLKIEELQKQFEQSVSRVTASIQSFNDRCIHPKDFIELVEVTYYEEGGGGQCVYERSTKCSLCLLSISRVLQEYRRRLITAFRFPKEYTFEEDTKEMKDWLSSTLDGLKHKLKRDVSTRLGN